MSNLTAFNQTTANDLFNSTNPFPVSFDDAWQWLEYDKKGNAKRYLVENLEEGIDFLINQELGSLAVPRPSEQISLSIEGFKNWAMMSKTDTGKQVRKYFIECERIAKLVVQQPELTYERNFKLAQLLGAEIESKMKNKGVAKQIAIKALGLVLPQELQPALEEAKLEIAKENAISSNELFTATNIGHILADTEGLEEFNTARKVNKLLENLGLQTKGRKNWIATSKAKRLNLATELEIVASLDQKNSKWAGVQLRWKEDIIDYIIDEYNDYQAM